MFFLLHLTNFAAETPSAKDGRYEDLNIRIMYKGIRIHIWKLLFAVAAAWGLSVTMEAQTDRAWRVFDDGAPRAARVVRVCDPRQLMDIDWPEFAASEQTGSEARDMVARLRDYMASHPDAPDRNRLRARLAQAYYACGDCYAMADMMGDVDVEALPDE